MKTFLKTARGTLFCVSWHKKGVYSETELKALYFTLCFYLF